MSNFYRPDKISEARPGAERTREDATAREFAFKRSFLVTTSTRRPPRPKNGDLIFETDTGNSLVFNASLGRWTPGAWNSPWGVVAAYTSSGLTAAGIGQTISDFNVSTSFTWVSGRRYMVSGSWSLIANATAEVVVILTDAANNRIMTAAVFSTTPGWRGGAFSGYLDYDLPTGVVHTVKLRGFITAGLMDATETPLSFTQIIVTDVGPQSGVATFPV